MLETYEIYQLIAQATQQINERQEQVYQRRAALQSFAQPLVKQAFDTRRIDQNTQYNPRRNLQYYLREQPFINDADVMKIEALTKLKKVSDTLKDAFMGEPEWFDSYASDLDHTLSRTFFKADGKNFDFSPTHIQYLEQQLEDRYRLKLSDIISMTEQHLQALIIHKDERLEKSSIYKSGDLSKINKQKANKVSEGGPKIVQPSPLQMSAQSHDQMWNLTQTIFTDDLAEAILTDEKKLNKLRLDEISLNNKLAHQKNQLQIIQQEKNQLHQQVLEKYAQEKNILTKLWSDHHALQKVTSGKKSLDGLIAINANYQTDAHKLIAGVSNDINLLTNSMIQNRPIYDRLHNERLSVSKSWQEKIDHEKKASQAVTNLQTQVDQINQEQTIIREKVQNNMRVINKLRINKGD